MYYGYDYEEAMKKDIETWMYLNGIDVNGNHSVEELRDMMWNEESVTGNGFNYYASNEQCKGFVCDFNLDLAKEALMAFDSDVGAILDILLTQDWQSVDCAIRCYLIEDVLDDLIREAE